MNYDDCTLVELRQMAKEKGIKGCTKLKKEELIDLLNKTETTSANTLDKTRRFFN